MCVPVSHVTVLLCLPDLSLNDAGSRNAQKITLSIRLSPTSVESKLNEVSSLFSCINLLVLLHLLSYYTTISL